MRNSTKETGWIEVDEQIVDRVVQLSYALECSPSVLATLCCRYGLHDYETVVEESDEIN